MFFEGLGSDLPYVVLLKDILVLLPEWELSSLGRLTPAVGTAHSKIWPHSAYAHSTHCCVCNYVQCTDE